MLPDPHHADLTARRRVADLDLLATERFDVIVVGGGITGAGVALDAASRGLRTALVERVDLAAGTSRWSSKLVHGGLRYLAKGRVDVAWESSVERRHLLRTIAPHLVHPYPFLVPLGAGTPPALGLATELGTRAGDLMRAAAGTRRSALPPTRRLAVAEALVEAPGLRREGLRGALTYWDCRLEDDARLVIAVARTAAALGAHVLTGVAAGDLRQDRLTLTDLDSGRSFEAHGQVVNATGVWVGEHEPSLTVVPSLGTHLVLRSARLGDPRAVITAPVPGHLGRFVFAIPQPDGLCLLGLTDEEAPGVDGIAPPVPPADEEFLLATINSVLSEPLTAADVVGRFAGLRPLVRTGADDSATSDISRAHLLLDEPGRPITIAGGKLTTYRRMAQDAVDVAARRLGVATPSVTTTIPLVGAAAAQTLAAVQAPARLVRRYGTEAPRVAELALNHPELGAPVAPGCPTIGAELAFGVLAEGARTVADLVERRTRVTFVEADVGPAREAAERVLARLGAQALQG